MRLRLEAARSAALTLLATGLATGVTAGSLAALPASATGAPAKSARTAAAAAPYLQPTDSITPARGCIVLKRGFNGIKVRMVQRRLGLGSRWETMDSVTVDRVQRFQRRNGLRAHGRVNRATWEAMGFRHDFCFDRWQAAPLPIEATRRERIRTMVRFALRYRGAEYVWGGAGRPKYGVDCSGLVLQALYRAGLDPQPISIDKHVRPLYRTSKAMFEHPDLRHRSWAKRKRGDLVFYRKDSTGDINHVAILLNRRSLVEAKGDDVHVTRIRAHYPNQSLVRSVVRPF
jgi:NlpC/P60 family/Putative peptidoglycan binding domain